MESTFKDEINPKRQTAFRVPLIGDRRNWTSPILGLMLAVINDPTSTHPVKGMYPCSFDAFTPDMACTGRIYGLFATWLAVEYDTSDGRADQPTFLSPDVAVAYLRALIHTGKAKFGHIGASRASTPSPRLRRPCGSRASSTACTAPCVSGYRRPRGRSARRQLSARRVSSRSRH